MNAIERGKKPSTYEPLERSCFEYYGPRARFFCQAGRSATRFFSKLFRTGNFSPSVSCSVFQDASERPGPPVHHF